MNQEKTEKLQRAETGENLSREELLDLARKCFLAREELKREKSLRDSVFDSLNDAIVVVDARTMAILDANRLYLEWAGEDISQVRGKFCWDLHHPSLEVPQGKVLDCPLQRAARDGLPARMEHSHRLPDGTVRHLEVTAHPVRDPEGRVTRLLRVARDITAQKTHEEQILGQKAFLEMVVGHLPVGAFAKDAGAGLRYTIWNNRMEDMSGLDKEMVLGRADGEVFPEGDFADRLERADREALALPGGRVSEESWPGGDGEQMLARVWRVPVPGPDGSPSVLLGILEDITARRKAQAQTQLMALLMDLSPDPIILVDKDYRYQVVNRAQCEMHGRPREDFLGKKLEDVLEPGYYRKTIKPRLDQCLKGKALSAEEWFQYPGGPRYVLVSYTPFMDGEGKLAGVLVTVRDITDRHRAQEERLVRERLQSAMETAGAAAHELNQPLQAVGGELELLLEDLGPGEPAGRVRELLEQVDRMGRITRRLNRLTAYRTMDYAAGKRILDLEKSSEG